MNQGGRHYVNRLFVLLFGLFCWQHHVCSQTSDVLTIRDFKRMGIPFYTGNDVHLLTSGVAKFEDMFSALKEAKEYIHMDYFKFQEDSICGALFDILRQKAREGVKVRIVYDSFGNSHSTHPLSRKFLSNVTASGIQIYEFDRVRFPWVNHLFHRNHHKIAVIDGRVVYSGGMNVADYYLHGKPKIGEWRDMHMRIEGPAVKAYDEVFLDMWAASSRDSLPPLSKCIVNDRDEATSLIALVNRVPRTNPSIMRDAYCASIDNAKHLVQIVNPYPCLFGEVRDALCRALRRGVQVQFLVSVRSDGMANADVVGVEMRKLQKLGADIFYYEGGFHHGKVMIVDGLFCTVGTANLDGRSLCFDYEINSFIFDSRVTGELQALFLSDVKAHCIKLDDSTWKSLFPLRRRVRSRFYMLIKRLL